MYVLRDYCIYVSVCVYERYNRRKTPCTFVWVPNDERATERTNKRNKWMSEWVSVMDACDPFVVYIRIERIESTLKTFKQRSMEKMERARKEESELFKKKGTAVRVIYWCACMAPLMLMFSGWNEYTLNQTTTTTTAQIKVKNKIIKKKKREHI